MKPSVVQSRCTHIYLQLFLRSQRCRKTTAQLNISQTLRDTPIGLTQYSVTGHCSYRRRVSISTHRLKPNFFTASGLFKRFCLCQLTYYNIVYDDDDRIRADTTAATLHQTHQYIIKYILYGSFVWKIINATITYKTEFIFG